MRLAWTRKLWQKAVVIRYKRIACLPRYKSGSDLDQVSLLTQATYKQSSSNDGLPETRAHYKKPRRIYKRRLFKWVTIAISKSLNPKQLTLSINDFYKFFSEVLIRLQHIDFRPPKDIGSIFNKLLVMTRINIFSYIFTVSVSVQHHDLSTLGI